MKYEERHCDVCNTETVHRTFRRFGKSAKGKGKGHKSLRRSVIWCMTCQKRRIEKPKSYKG